MQPDPRALALAVAVLSARRAGVRFEVADLLDDLDISPLSIIGGLISLAEELLAAAADQDALLASVGLKAARRTAGASDG